MSYYHSGTIAYLLENYDMVKPELPKRFLQILLHVEKPEIQYVFAKFKAEGMALAAEIRQAKANEYVVKVIRLKTFSYITHINSLGDIIKSFPEIFDIPYGDWYYYTSSMDDPNIYNIHDTKSYGTMTYKEFFENENIRRLA